MVKHALTHRECCDEFDAVRHALAHRECCDELDNVKHALTQKVTRRDDEEIEG